MKNNEIKVFTESAIEAINKSEIEAQLDAAHKYPRNLNKFKENAIYLATQDLETAKSCIYYRPVGNGTIAEGMSIRLAEIVAAYYGNIRVGVRTISQDERKVVVQGVAFDVELNNMQTSEVVEATVTKEGKPYSEHMRIVVQKAALAKARRDAIFMVIPRALCKVVENAVKDMFANDAGKNLKNRVERALNWTDEIKVNRKDVYRVLGVKNKEYIGVEELETLTGLKTAIEKEGVSIDAIFKELDDDETTEQVATSVINKKSNMRNNKSSQTNLL